MNELRVRSVGESRKCCPTTARKALTNKVRSQFNDILMTLNMLLNVGDFDVNPLHYGDTQSEQQVFF